MRLHQNASLAHFFLLNAEDLAQGVHLPAHVLQHLVDGVDLHFAFLIALQGEANGHMLGRFHQQRGPSIVVLRNGRGEGLQELLQIDLRIWAGLAELLPQRFRVGIWILTGLPEMCKQANGLDDFLFFERNSRSGAAGSRAWLTCCAALTDRGTPQRSSAWYATGLCTFSGGDQLQEFLWLVEPLFELRAERLGCDLGGHADFAGGRIGSHELHFIDLDAGFLVVAQGFFDLLSHVLGFRSRIGESFYQACEVFHRDLGGKMDAGQPSGSQQLRKAALSLTGFQWYAVQQ